MFWVVVAILYFVLAAVAPGILGLFVSRTRPDFGTLALSLRILFVAIALTCLAATSYVHVESDEIAVLNKIYGTTSLPGEHIIAIHGEKGPQAEILTPGWHPWFLVNVIYQVENKKVVSVPSGKYGFLSAKDGAPLRPAQYLADAFSSGHELDMLDAEYFLTHGGERGPQTTVLTPGNYRLNTYLWDVDIEDAVDIPKGSVGVIKSNVVAAVNFGNMVAQKPSSSSCQQKRVSANASGEAIAADQKKKDEGVLTAILVPVGCIGVWEQALQPGRYYINEAGYKVTMISTRVQTWEFKGGYKKRYIDLSLDQAGNLTQSQRSQDIPVPEGAADPAVTPFVEGWLVPLELRVLAQVTPDNAPFVVAAVGGLPEIENNIMVPTIRSIVRNVVGATGRHVLDLADNRAELEHAVEDAIRPEGMRAGIIIKEVKFGDVALPPELLVSRLRQQLADQLQLTYQQEQKAQTQRIQTEKARATAELQHQLVEALIGVQVAEQNRNAAKLRGEGQKLELEETAQGQKAQADVLGQDRVLTINLVQQFLKTIEQKPEIVSLIGRLVPLTVVSTGGQGTGLDSAAAIFGALLNNGGGATPALTGSSTKK
jgi:regulator of protease activity HflC (stomatin/prohibitin superfamily)